VDRTGLQSLPCQEHALRRMVSEPKVPRPLSENAEASMAVNKPTGDNARKGAVKKRTQLKNPLTQTSTKRNKKGGQFMAVKKSAKKFKGVRRER
jgi:hypothetical protein